MEQLTVSATGWPLLFSMPKLPEILKHCGIVLHVLVTHTLWQYANIEELKVTTCLENREISRNFSKNQGNDGKILSKSDEKLSQKLH